MMLTVTKGVFGSLAESSSSLLGQKSSLDLGKACTFVVFGELLASEHYLAKSLKKIY